MRKTFSDLPPTYMDSYSASPTWHFLYVFVFSPIFILLFMFLFCLKYMDLPTF